MINDARSLDMRCTSLSCMCTGCAIPCAGSAIACAVRKMSRMFVYILATGLIRTSIAAVCGQALFSTWEISGLAATRTFRDANA